MPARKLSQEDLDDLRDAETELLNANPRIILRPNGDGHHLQIATLKQLAEWKGISESHFYAHKRGGWKLKRGIPFEDKTPDTVPAEMLQATFNLGQKRIEELLHRIAELEAENEQLRRNKP